MNHNCVCVWCRPMFAGFGDVKKKVRWRLSVKWRRCLWLTIAWLNNIKAYAFECSLRNRKWSFCTVRSANDTQAIWPKSFNWVIGVSVIGGEYKLILEIQRYTWGLWFNQRTFKIHTLIEICTRLAIINKSSPITREMCNLILYVLYRRYL